MIRLLSFICILGTSTAWADDLGAAPPMDEAELKIEKSKKNRSSRISFSFTGDGEDYSSTNLGVRLGLDETWQIQISGTANRSEGAVGYRSLSIKADDLVSDFFSFNFGLRGQNEPNSLTAGGGNLGLDFTISELWQGELDTTISISGEGLVYSIPILGKFGQNRAVTTLQRSFSLSISQDITSTVSVDLSASTYTYGLSRQNLSRFVNGRIMNLPGVVGIISGFPESYASLGASWQFSDAFTVGASASRSVGSVDDATTRGLGISLDWKAEKNWGAGIEFLSSQSDDSAIPSKTMSLNGSYRW